MNKNTKTMWFETLNGNPSNVNRLMTKLKINESYMTDIVLDLILDKIKKCSL